MFRSPDRIIFGLLRSALSELFRSPSLKGRVGETKVNIGTDLLLNKRVYHLFNDVTLPFGKSTTQIDQIILSVYGVFVIETKNMSGWIFGDSHQAHWTQVIYSRKSRFRNPLRQNYRHVKVVQELLGLRPDEVFNVVVFVGDSEFKTPMPPEVIHGVVGLSKYIKSKRHPLIAESVLPDLIETLSSSRLAAGRRTNRTHIRNVNNEESLCPRCGHDLVERTNRSTGDKFLGCSRFPQCKGTRRLD